MRPAYVRDIGIRRCTSGEYAFVGRMLVEAYAALPGMPQPHEQPEYYDMLTDVGRRDGNPAIRVFVATNGLDEPVGCIDFIRDMKHYGSAGAASGIANAAGIRLLAVRRDWRGAGIGKALTGFCIEQARALHRSKVVLHTTRVMRTAWSLYERMGFERFPEIDFQQGRLEVFGFKLELERE
jgi:GNAT superfamily N-acetyltransferase